MTGHTPEPWGPFDNPPLTMITLNKYDYDRARACVNACAGIPTEQLAKGNVAALIKSLSEITQDMDEDSDGTCETLWEEVADARAALAPFRED